MNNVKTIGFGIALAATLGAGYLLANATPESDSAERSVVASKPTVWATSTSMEDAMTVCVGPTLEKGIEVTLVYVGWNNTSPMSMTTKRYADPFSYASVDLNLLEVTPLVPWGQVESDEDLELVRIVED